LGSVAVRVLSTFLKADTAATELGVNDMNHTHHLSRIVAGTLLSGGVALAGFSLPAATAHAGPVSAAEIAASNPAPESPRVRAGFDPQPEPPVKKTIAVGP
jgi:hypothetical protein